MFGNKLKAENKRLQLELDELRNMMNKGLPDFFVFLKYIRSEENARSEASIRTLKLLHKHPRPSYAELFTRGKEGL